MTAAARPSRRFDDPDRSFQMWIDDSESGNDSATLLRVFDQMVERHPDLICVYRPSGEIMYVNRTFADFFGKQRRDVVGSYLPDLAEDSQRELAENNLHRVADLEPDDGPSRAEVELTDATGRSRWVEWSDQPIFGADDRVSLISGVGRDVTDRHLAEERLIIANRRLEESNRDLGDFAYVASHDLQEPLRKITTFSDRLATRAADELSEKNLDYLNRINGAAGRMQRLVDDLLTFSRVTTRGQGFEAVDLGEVMTEVVSDLELAIAESGARIDVGPLPTVRADQTQMHQLFQNLVSNAVKFRATDRRPVIEIDARSVGGSPDSPGMVEIEVRDNGIGFDQKYSEKIFTVFQRLHGRMDYPGSGIGLAVCRRIAERHDGALRCTSAPDEGARFVFSLPAQ